MRGELLGIRDSVSRYSWRKYAESKLVSSAVFLYNIYVSLTKFFKV